MTQKEKRNMQGCFIAFILGLLLGGIGCAIMMWREVDQAVNNNQDVEADDVQRYSGIAAFGYVIQLTVLVYLLTN